MKKSYTFYIALLMLLTVSFSLETGWAQDATFNFTGGQQDFVVPSGVCSIHIEAWGAEAASGTIGTAGLGGFAEGDLDVIQGQTLNIFVGGQGSTVNNSAFGGGGFNGGGNARGGQSTDAVTVRAGGGGASDVRVGGTSLVGRVIVAGGGGGACGSSTFNGGNGGGLVGGNATGIGGEGGVGTQVSGGAGGAGSDCTAGVFGIGGDAGGNSCSGGGGGWFGGGSGCGAGGGSSYIDGVDDGNTSSGQREGNGMVVLTWTPNSNCAHQIPTLSEWGLIAMAGILGIVGFMVIRRRKVTA